MNIEDFYYVSNAIMLAFLVGIPVWFIFFARRYERSWPSVLRPLLAIACTIGAIHEFLDTLYYASSAAHTKNDATIVFGSPPLIRIIILEVVVAILVWLIVLPPHNEPSWSLPLRRLLAINCIIGVIYGFFFTVTYVTILTYLRTNPPMILDGPTLFHPTSVSVIVICSILFVFRLLLLRLPVFKQT